MALVNCPACSKRISNKSTVCPHCQSSINAVDDSAHEQAIYRVRWKKSQRRQYLSFFTLLMFLIGTVFYWMGMDDPDHWHAVVGKILLAAGFIGYAVLRIYHLLNK